MTTEERVSYETDIHEWIEARSWYREEGVRPDAFYRDLQQKAVKARAALTA
jgi:hypothetical protein